MMTHRRVAALLVAVLLGAASPAARAAAPSRAKVVAPTPESVIGFRPGADYKLATYEQIADYFHKLDAASDRIQVFDIGSTAEGRTQIAAVISSEANLKNLARYKDIARKLALARDLTDDQARALAKEGKAIVWIDYGLHATEVAHGQTSPEMAYKAVTEESDEMRFIRDNVIFVTVPVMNPDGMDITVNWYRKNVGTPYETAPLPELFHKYVGHDNNRDWFMFNMPESRNVAHLLYEEFFPQIVYNQHQSAPFPARIFVPPFDDPMNYAIPPLVMRGVELVGDAMTKRFTQEGKRGALSRVGFDTWWNGGMRTAPYFHNMVGILTETALYRYATPGKYDPAAFPKTFSTGVPTDRPTTFYPDPWLGTEWHLRDAVDYMLTGSMAVLDIGARLKYDWLYNIYQMGKWAIEAGRNEPPYAYIVPADQWDPGAAAKMIETLRIGAIEIEKASAPFTAGGTSYAAGSYVIPMAQPFRAYVKDLLEPQQYPDRRAYPGGPPLRPYDITGWTLPYQMGVTVAKIDQPFQAALVPAVHADRPPARVDPPKAAYVLDPRRNDSYLAVNRLLKQGETVSRVAGPLQAGAVSYPPGAFVVAVESATTGRVQRIATDLGLTVTSLEQMPAPGATRRLGAPRIGLYQAWGGNMDEGWTRWILEQFDYPYVSLHDKNIRAGNLRAALDVILLPDASYEQMLNGMAPGSMPPEYTGGLGVEGIAALKDFVRNGGTLVGMDRAAALPVEAFGLGMRNVLGGLRSQEFYCPGSVLQIDLDPSQPVAYGMPRTAGAFFIESPAFEIGRGGSESGEEARGSGRKAANIALVARYPARDFLMSGWILGEHRIAGKIAVADVSLDKGRVVLLGFRSQHRGQPLGTYKLLFNSILESATERSPEKTTSPEK